MKFVENNKGIFKQDFMRREHLSHLEQHLVVPWFQCLWPTAAPGARVREISARVCWDTCASLGIPSYGGNRNKFTLCGLFLLLSQLPPCARRVTQTPFSG